MGRGYLAIGLAASVIIAACVGDTGASGQPGDEGYPCLSDGTCKKGLSCASKVCVALDSGTSGDAGGTDSSTDSATGADASGSTCRIAMTRICAGTCLTAQNQYCCLDNGQCVTNPMQSNCVGDVYISCQSQADCAGGATKICAIPSNVTADFHNCPGVLSFVQAVPMTTCESSLAAGDLLVCTSDTDCATGHCYTMQWGGGQKIGVCH